MNINLLPSELVTTLRDRLKPYAHDGLTLAPEGVCSLLRTLRTIEEAVRDLEEDNRIQEHRLRALSDNLRNAGGRAVDIGPDGNVVRLPTKPRVIFTRPDGGDAA